MKATSTIVLTAQSNGCRFWNSLAHIVLATTADVGLASTSPARADEGVLAIFGMVAVNPEKEAAASVTFRLLSSHCAIGQRHKRGWAGPLVRPSETNSWQPQLAHGQMPRQSSHSACSVSPCLEHLLQPGSQVDRSSLRVTSPKLAPLVVGEVARLHVSNALETNIDCLPRLPVLPATNSSLQ